MNDEDARTIWIGNLSDKVTEDVLYELFIQGGPVQKVTIPKDRDGKQKNFGFVTYKHVCSVPYALELFDGTTLFNRSLNMKSRNNTLENAQHHQFQMQHQQFQQQQLQGNMFDNRHCNVQNDLQLGQQILLGNLGSLHSLPVNSMYMMPGGSYAYPSQNSLYPQNNVSKEYSRNNRHHRNHPYQDRDRDRNRDHDREYDYRNDRHSSRQDSYDHDHDHDHKSYKHSHRSNRHDNRRKYR